MRGKKAKQLRRMAKAATSPKSPDVAYESIQHTRTHTDNYDKIFKYNVGVQIVLALGCVRGVYQDLKRMNA